MKRWIIGGTIFLVIVGGVVVFAKYPLRSPSGESLPLQGGDLSVTSVVPEAPKPVVTHVATPVPVKAVYMSSWVASNAKTFAHVMNLVDTTEVNAIVLDIKDATGRVSFLTNDPVIAATGSPENRIRNINEFINALHAKNVYVIGRISTFQDSYLTKVKPEWAITKKSDGGVWKDRKGLAFLDPANPLVLEYLTAVAKVSYEVGFDEINFDYIRYPSDGNVKDIDYKLAIKADGTTATRAENIAMFSQKINEALRLVYPEIKTSADLFGLTTTETTDMGIGQVLEKLLPHFDYIGPMIYPSHYAKGEYGIASPANAPYEIVTKALAGAKRKIEAMDADPNLAQSVKDHVQFSQIRPWIQDFSIGGVTYTADMVRAQMKATYDAGLDSWMMWDPTNKYTTAAYLKDGAQ